jgi:hypothetical protein
MSVDVKSPTKANHPRISLSKVTTAPPKNRRASSFFLHSCLIPFRQTASLHLLQKRLNLSNLMERLQISTCKATIRDSLNISLIPKLYPSLTMSHHLTQGSFQVTTRFKILQEETSTSLQKVTSLSMTREAEEPRFSQVKRSFKHPIIRAIREILS